MNCSVCHFISGQSREKGVCALPKKKYNVRIKKKPNGPLITKICHFSMPKGKFCKLLMDYGYMVYWIREIS